MNIDKILKLADLLDNLPEPEEFNMGNYYHSCGSPSCIAGWTLHMEGVKQPYDRGRSFSEYERRIHPTAQNILGITEKQGYQLFTPSYHIGSVPEGRFDDDSQYRYSLFSADNKEAAHILRNLAETGEVDYSIVVTNRMKEEEDDE